MRTASPPFWNDNYLLYYLIVCRCPHPDSALLSLTSHPTLAHLLFSVSSYGSHGSRGLLSILFCWHSESPQYQEHSTFRSLFHIGQFYWMFQRLMHSSLPAFPCVSVFCVGFPTLVLCSPEASLYCCYSSSFKTTYGWIKWVFVEQFLGVLYVSWVLPDLN